MRITVTTINIWSGGKMLAAIIDFINDINADIVFMQEVHSGDREELEDRFKTITVLAKQLPAYHIVFSPAYLDITPNLHIQRGNAILSKLPLHTFPDLFYDLPYGEFDTLLATEKTYSYFPCVLQHARILVGDRELHLFNNHGIWGKDGRDTPRRLHMSHRIIDEFKRHKDVVLAGDFNCDPTTQTIYTIETKLINVFKDELKTTFNMSHKSKPGYADAVSDMMFVSKTIGIGEHYCAQVDISDHYPLVATLNL